MATLSSSFNETARKMAAGILERSRPLSAQAHIIRGSRYSQLFVANGSRLKSINDDTADHFAALLEAGSQEALAFELKMLGLDGDALINDQPLQNPPLHALSLSIAQKCNMGCTYCYAQQGSFGGSATKMPLDVAIRSIDLLLKDKQPGDRVQLTFLGGEPLLSRKEIIAATEYAARVAAEKMVHINFSVTTNGTLLNENDAAFFEQYGFAVTVSLDGLKEEHDRQRPLKNHKGSYDLIMSNIKPLLKLQKKMQVSARVTVTHYNLNIAGALDEFIEMGFHSVGFSPLLKAPNGLNELSKDDLMQLLSGMIECGLRFEEAVLKGKRYPFLNMINAFKEIGKGTHRPYPCGAGAGYLGVSSEGELFACHRFVNDPAGSMGTITGGVNEALQQEWLSSRHVHKQTPCSQCWARYLCGGSCHYEVIDKGRIACDYIRGWLYFAMQSYERINRLMPGWNK
jgi:uncharacterized protein